MSDSWTNVARPTLVRALTRAGRSMLLPPVLVVLIYLLGRAIPGKRSVLVIGVLDEPAHLATAVLVLIALAGGRRLAAAPAFTVTALGMSMAIDIDHLPLYAGVPGVADAGNRPYTHSIATVVVLLLAWLVGGRRRIVLAGAMVGVVLHFVRDVATGPGLQLWWPLSDQDVRLPYGWYLTVVVAAGVIAGCRALRERLGRRS